MFDKLIQYLVNRAGKEYSGAYKTSAAMLGATLFLAGWPALVWFCGSFSDGTLFPSGVAKILSLIFFLVGTPWVLWAVFWQLWKGNGTPVPSVPTKNFLNSGPYRFCRNPMMMGFFIYLGGWAALFNRPGAYIAALLLEILLLLEIKFIEEKALEQRFGDAYREYKKETPFFIPRFK